MLAILLAISLVIVFAKMLAIVLAISLVRLLAERFTILLAISLFILLNKDASYIVSYLGNYIVRYLCTCRQLASQPESPHSCFQKDNKQTRSVVSYRSRASNFFREFCCKIWVLQGGASIYIYANIYHVCILCKSDFIHFGSKVLL